MPTYRRESALVEAVRLTSEPPNKEIIEFLRDATYSLTAEHGLVIHTLEGDLRVRLGWWIIRGVGELYPCRPDIFEATYESAERSDSEKRPDPFDVESAATRAGFPKSASSGPDWRARAEVAEGFLRALVMSVGSFARENGGELPHVLNLTYSLAVNQVRALNADRALNDIRGGRHQQAAGAVDADKSPRALRPDLPRWERIFTETMIHAGGCPFVEGDEHGDGHVECECYVSDLWDALQEVLA